MKKILELKEEIKELLIGKQIAINVGGTFYLYTRIRLLDEILHEEGIVEMEFTNSSFSTQDPKTQGFVDCINDFDLDHLWSPDYFEEYQEVNEFKIRIDNFVSECNKIAKEYKVDDRDFLKNIFISRNTFDIEI